MVGKLYVVATPIGNLGDISYRAVKILSSVAAIAAEDTRHSQRLLQHYQIDTPVFALHDHNEQAKSQAVLARLQAGDDLALISDAGTPLISDPGFHVVKFLHQHDITIVPIPGACAAITALSVAGLPTNQFYFVGFLHAKAHARQQQLQQLAEHAATLIFYEAPHRILATLIDMQQMLGEQRQAVLARELTKTFETIKCGQLSEIYDVVQQDSNQQKGEIVLLVQGSEQQSELDSHAQHTMAILAAELPVKQAAKLAADITGVKKNQLYSWWIAQDC